MVWSETTKTRKIKIYKLRNKRQRKENDHANEEERGITLLEEKEKERYH